MVVEGIVVNREEVDNVMGNVWLRTISILPDLVVFVLVFWTARFTSKSKRLFDCCLVAVEEDGDRGERGASTTPRRFEEEEPIRMSSFDLFDEDEEEEGFLWWKLAAWRPVGQNKATRVRSAKARMLVVEPLEKAVDRPFVLMHPPLLNILIRLDTNRHNIAHIWSKATSSNKKRFWTKFINTFNPSPSTWPSVSSWMQHMMAATAIFISNDSAPAGHLFCEQYKNPDVITVVVVSSTIDSFASSLSFFFFFVFFSFSFLLPLLPLLPLLSPRVEASTFFGASIFLSTHCNWYLLFAYRLPMATTAVCRTRGVGCSRTALTMNLNKRWGRSYGKRTKVDDNKDAMPSMPMQHNWSSVPSIIMVSTTSMIEWKLSVLVWRAVANNNCNPLTCTLMSGSK